MGPLIWIIKVSGRDMDKTHTFLVKKQLTNANICFKLYSEHLF